MIRRGIRNRRIYPRFGAAIAPGIVTDATGIVCAIGLRKLISTYTGYCCNIVRASDSATLDVGFVAATGEVDVAAATAFKGASTIKVVTWYDQSGNGRDITQATDANRPVLNLANADMGGKASVDFANATATRMQSAVWGTSYDTNTACFCVSKNTQTNGVVLDTSTTDGNRIEMYNGDGATQNPYMWGGSSGMGANLGPITVVACAQGDGVNDAWWVNDKTTARATGSRGACLLDGLVVGRYFGGGSHMTGPVRNIVCHSGVLSTANRQAIMQALADDIGLIIS